MAAARMIGVIQWGRLEFLLFLVVAAALVIGVTAFWNWMFVDCAKQQRT